MSFYPFGYSFELHTLLTFEQCREEIERRLVPMGKRPNAERPRGYFLGCRLMLWMLPYDLIDGLPRPKLLCRFRQDITGTTVNGRVVPSLGASFGLCMWTLLSLMLAIYLLGKVPPYPVANPLTYDLVKLGLVLASWGFLAGLFWNQHIARFDGRPMETWLRRVLSAEKRKEAR